MDDAGGPQSLFIVVSWNTYAPYSSSIIQLETPPHVYKYEPMSANTPVFPADFSAHFPRLSQLQRPIRLVMANSTEDLYMLPDCALKESQKMEDGTLPGFIFNLSNEKCKVIKPPLAPKYMGHAVMLGDHLYFMAEPLYCPYSPDPRFERYDTLSQKWEELEPLPLDPTYGDYPTGRIKGTAVLDDTILFYMEDPDDGPDMQAYNVGSNKWYPVEVLDDLCYSFVGVAVVLNNIIYCLTEYGESVLALTLISQEKDGDLVFTCDLHKEYKVPYMNLIKFDRFGLADHWTKHLVHLGKDNFCVVQSCNRSDVETQYIQLTNIELREENLIVTNICVHEFKLPRDGLFMIRHCFAMPKCKTTTALTREHEAEIVTLPPELLQFQDKYASQTKKAPQVQEDVPKKSSEGHSVYVRNLPPDANPKNLLNVLKKFGPIKNVAVQACFVDMSECCFGDVEFESATSKQNAIKASPIKIGGCLAVIEEKRRTPLLTHAEDDSRSKSTRRNRPNKGGSSRK